MSLVPKKKSKYFSKLTIIVNEQGQILPEVRVDVEQQSRTLAGPEAQGDVFSSQCHIRVDGEWWDTVVQTKFRRLLQVVREGCAWLKVGCNLWELGSYGFYSRVFSSFYTKYDKSAWTQSVKLKFKSISHISSLICIETAANVFYNPSQMGYIKEGLKGTACCRSPLFPTFIPKDYWK